MTKQNNEESKVTNPSVTEEGKSEVRPIDDQGVNEELNSIISDYWKENQAPGFTGFKQLNANDDEEEVRFVENDSNKPSRHTRKTDKDEKKPKKKKKKSKLVKAIKIIIFVLILLLAAGIGTFAFMRYQGEKASKEEVTSEEIKTVDDAVSENAGKTVIYKGDTYVYNDNISSILFIGVDREDNDVQQNGENGQSDTVVLFTIDHETGESKMLPISRNSMVMVDEYNTDGSYWRQSKVQLAVSFAYGDGKEGSCENVSKAVSRLLYGMPINKYVCFDLACIAKLNDEVGGVTVTVPEDMTHINEDWTAGAEITLHGEEAQAFVRNRKTTVSEDDQDNNAARMERQKIFMSSFVNTVLAKMKSNMTLPVDLYNAVSDDMITDVTTSEVVYYASLIASKGFNNTVLSIDGKVKHDKFTEFYPDEEQLYQLILDTFYTRQ